ncbi:MAG: type II toxin-antitoxin system RelE/ParE family toxin [Bacteroidota bacterium]|nr:type II toxin-antitoxin system RelE/ParE family toxin [Bacteroidota bacterium]
MSSNFKVEFLEEAKEFLDNLDEKPREKIYYNIWKSTQVKDNELFKKLEGEIWEFRTRYQNTYYRLFAFWDKSSVTGTVVISTHGIIKKTDKTPKSEIERAEQLRQKYINSKRQKS